MSARVWLIGFLFAAVLGSALGVIYSKHQGRKLFIELEALNQERDALNVEWGQLQLEQSTWATHGRVEEVARERLGMSMPDARSAVIVRIE